MLKGYFDDSGTDGGQPVEILAGFLAETAVWEAVEAEWTILLADYARYGVSWFHLTEIISGQNDWFHVPSQIRELTPLQFANVLKEHEVVAVWASVECAAWQRVSRGPLADVFPTPFDLCYDQVLRQAKSWSETRRTVAPIELIFSTQTSHADRMVKSYGWYAENSNISGLVTPIQFDSPRKRNALQAADLIATAMLRAAKERLSTPSGDFFGEHSFVLHTAAQSNGLHNGIHYDQDRLLEALRLPLARLAVV